MDQPVMRSPKQSEKEKKKQHQPPKILFLKGLSKEPMIILKKQDV